MPATNCSGSWSALSAATGADTWLCPSRERHPLASAGLAPRLALAPGHRGHPWGNTPRHLLRDRDAVYGRDLRQRVRRIGIDAIATPVARPRANAIAERVIGTLRRECLDYLIILDEQHLRSVL